MALTGNLRFDRFIVRHLIVQVQKQVSTRVQHRRLNSILRMTNGQVTMGKVDLIIDERAFFYVSYMNFPRHHCIRIVRILVECNNGEVCETPDSMRYDRRLTISITMRH